MFGLGFQELALVGVVAVLLFGKRLPEVARSLGKSYTEFRRGLTDIQSTFDYTDTGVSSKPTYSSSTDEYDEYDEPTAPKFEPPPSEPQIPTGDISKLVSEK
jgi:sec-independent protein translocase protein TatA